MLRHPPGKPLGRDCPVGRIPGQETDVLIPPRPKEISAIGNFITPTRSRQGRQSLRGWEPGFLGCYPERPSANIDPFFHTNRVDIVLVEMVDIFNRTVLFETGKRNKIKKRKMLNCLTQTYPSGMGDTGMPNLAARARMAIFSLTPATRALSICKRLTAPLSRSWRAMTRLAICSQ